MNRTHNEAIAIFAAGNIDAAWEIAKKDEGMHEGVTLDQWVSFAERCIAVESHHNSLEWNA